mmetsp:Transcript_65104/g.199105  ORF Transcript_65104/g.199105 Transcript_65104/m.199105 type:complete len:219 (-) Transcript_65104:2-658(-)
MNTFEPVFCRNSWMFAPFLPMSLPRTAGGTKKYKQYSPGALPMNGDSPSLTPGGTLFARSCSAHSTTFGTTLSIKLARFACSSAWTQSTRNLGSGKRSSRLLNHKVQPVSASISSRVLPPLPMCITTSASGHSNLNTYRHRHLPGTLPLSLPLPPKPPLPPMGPPRAGRPAPFSGRFRLGTSSPSFSDIRFMAPRSRPRRRGARAASRGVRAGALRRA